MATGGGKTVVMAMLIAWQTLNKVQSPRDARFTNRFLVVTPGHHDPRPAPRAAARGCRELLRPARPDPRRPQGRPRACAHRDHELPRLPAQGRQGDQGRRQEHAPPAEGRPQGRPVQGDAAGDGEPRPARPRARTSSRSWCSTTRRTTATRDRPLQGGEKADKEQQDANEQARVWFRGLQAIAKHAGIKQIWDLSATPFYLKGSGYNEGYIFPWTVSDFSLMDAIESGIVKVPRTPVDDDADRPARDLPAPVGLRRRPAPEARREGHGHGLAPAQGARGRAAQPPPPLREGVRALGEGAGAVRRDAAGLHRRLPQHRRHQAGLRLDRGRAGRRGRRGRRPQARQARAAHQRRRRQAARAAAHAS